MKDITEKHITELSKLWQEEIMELSEFSPESFDSRSGSSEGWK